MPQNLSQAKKRSAYVLDLIAKTFLGRGLTAVVPIPTYSMYGVLTSQRNATIDAVPRRPAAEGFALDVDAIVDRLPGADVVWLCTPNNPTGTTVTQAEFDAFMAKVPTDVLVVVDEAYAEFAEWSALELLDDERPMAVVRTFSKTWSMAAARLGYAVAPAWMVEELDKVVLPYHLDAAKQIAGRLAVKFLGEKDDRVHHIVAERDRIMAALGSMPVDVWESGSNFILFRPKEKDGRAVWQGLLDHSVLIRDCSGWPRLSGCLRVTIGTREEDDAFLVALGEVLAS